MTNDTKSILLVGASRGLGLAMAGEFLKKGWHVVGTVRGTARTKLHDLADGYEGRLEIETVDTTKPDEIAALHERLAGRTLDILFSNAGTADKNQDETIAQVPTDQFITVMLTNALGTMRVVETFTNLVHPNGTIGVMSSGQGSVSNNTTGGHEVYRGSKAALNMYMPSYAVRHADDDRAIILMAPGWVNTDLGGPEAPLSVDESIPAVVDVLLAQQGKPGIQFLDGHGKTDPW